MAVRTISELPHFKGKHLLELAAHRAEQMDMDLRGGDAILVGLCSLLDDILYHTPEAKKGIEESYKRDITDKGDQ